MEHRQYGFIKKCDFKTTTWSGGITSELIIFPKSASLKNRDFMFRISSAAINTPKSVFSDFTGYNRILASLSGIFKLNINGAVIILSPGEQRYFFGSEPVTCEGTGTDFNVIFKKGLKADLNLLNPVQTKALEIGKNTFHCFYPFNSESSMSLVINGLRFGLSDGALMVFPDPSVRLIRIEGTPGELILQTVVSNIFGDT